MGIFCRGDGRSTIVINPVLGESLDIIKFAYDSRRPVGIAKLPGIIVAAHTVLQVIPNSAPADRCCSGLTTG